MIKKFFKRTGIVILLYALLCLGTPFNKFLRNRSIDNQITYLSQILDKGYDNRLQRKFPEGKLFSNCLLSLSTIEYCDNNKIVVEKYAQIVDNCIKRIQSKKALSIFNPDLVPKYGMFYNGWSNYVYTTYQKSPLFKHSALREQVIEQCNEIESRLVATQIDSMRILDSYIEASWPADNLIGLLSLENDSIKQEWMTTILKSTEHESGLIHHSGSNNSIIRGSSTAMITFCLDRLEFEKSLIYNNSAKDIFIDEYLGIQLVKENEDGSSKMDVDSGPVVFGYGASATIMNIKTQASLNNPRSKVTWAAMNLISFPINLFGKKYYLFRQEPMFDLFMLWGSVEIN